MGMGYVPCDPFSWTCTLEVYAYFALVGWPWSLAVMIAVGGIAWLLCRMCFVQESKSHD